MKTIELPVIYTRNYDEVVEAEKMNVNVEKKEETETTTFFMPDDFYLRINPSTEKNRTTLYFSEQESYNVDADYETVLELFKSLIK